MTRSPMLHRLTLSLALCLGAGSMIALAAETTETTDISVSANGQTERLVLHDLAVGETRQLYSEAGTLVTATRTATTLELDIAGDRTSIPMAEPGKHARGEGVVWVESDAQQAEPGAKHVIRIVEERTSGEDGTTDADTSAHRVVMIAEGGELHELDGDDVHLVLKDGSDADGKRVIVERKVITTDSE